MVYNMLYYSESIPIVDNMSVTTPSPGGSDSSSDFELPQEHFTWQRQISSFKVLMTQRMASQPHLDPKISITSTPPPPSESNSSDFNLPPEHFTRERLMPSLDVLKGLQNMSIRKAPTTPRQISSSDDFQDNDRSNLSQDPGFSDSTSPSPFEPPSPDITFHGNPKGPDEEPTWRGINYNPSRRCP